MVTLVAGATGATGRLLVQQLLEQGHTVKAVVRSTTRLAHLQTEYPNLQQIEGTILDFSEEELGNHIRDCEAVVSCLGHNISFKGMYGKPRRLVRDSIKRMCKAIEKARTDKPTKVLLMNTTGNTNKDLKEHYDLKERMIINTLHVLLPPHTDNVQAAEFLRTTIGQNHSYIEWCAVRPDTLIDKEEVTDYELHPSPTGSVIFGARETSRVNVAHFMAKLATNHETWEEWKGKMPVVYNRE